MNRAADYLGNEIKDSGGDHAAAVVPRQCGISMLPTIPRIYSPQCAKMRWALTLTFGLIFSVANALWVWIARHNAFEVNGIELSALWYALALFAPGVSLVSVVLIPRTHRMWKNDRVAMLLLILLLSSFIHIPLLYVIGGFA